MGLGIINLFTTLRLKKCKPLVLLFFITISFTVKAQPNYLQFDVLNNGLSTNIVNAIYQDSKGWMWFSTSQGLNKYDGISINIYKSNQEDSTNLVGNLVRVIYEDKEGQLWVGTEAGGLNKFNRETEKFTCYFEYDSQNKKIFYSANTIAESKDGDLWVGTNMGLKKLNRSTQKFYSYTNNVYKPNSLCDNFIKKIFFDRAGNLWVGTRNGLDLYNPRAHYFEHIPVFKKDDLDKSVCEIFEDNEGKIWVGTYAKGIFVIDPLSKTFQQVIPDNENEFSLTVRAILQDMNGDYWIGTRGGLYIYSNKNKRFSRFEHDEKNPLSLCHNSVLSLYQDNKNDIWVGTRGGISYLINEKQVFRHYSAFSNDNSFLNNSDVYSFWSGPDKNIWIGTAFGGINILDRKKQTFRYITSNRHVTNSLSINSIKPIIDDGKGNLWIGTYLGGINVYNLQTGNITRYLNNPNDPGSIIDNRVWAICRDSKGLIWIGTGQGVDRYDAEKKKFIHYQSTFTNKQVDWIKEDSNNNLWIGTNPDIFIYNSKANSVRKITVNAGARAFFEDHNNRIWLATSTKGILLLDKNTGSVKKYYDEQTGIASNSTFSIIEDNQNTLWIGTANGLSRFFPDQEKFRNFFSEDGTQITHYNSGACYKLTSGELLFGGFNGFVLFDPEKIRDNVFLPPVVLTNFKILNKNVPVGTKDSPLKKHISETQSIVLKHNQNFITIQYVALNYCSPNKNRYAYKMEGIDKDWNYVGDKREASYTNLEPGTYKFSVKAANNDNQWNEVGTSLKIVIVPPFYKTWLFKIFSILLLFGFGFLLVYNRIQTIKKTNIILERLVNKKTHDLQQLTIELEESQSEIMAQNEEIEKQNESLVELNKQIFKQNEDLKFYANELENKVKDRTAELEIAKNKAEESDKLKSAILTNMSHEIRTPMNSIVGLSNLLMSGDVSSDDKVFFTINIKRNCDILLHLINDILDLSVIEAGKMPLHFKPVNIYDLLTGIYEVFESDKKWLDKSHIQLNLVIPTHKTIITTDPVRLEQIIRNFLHNAFKFTNEGQIEFGYRLTVLDIVFYVKDSGIGIPADKINTIFDRFVKLQNETAKTDFGVGLGLAICSKLAKMLNGKIWVESEVNQGSTFFVSIPITSTTSGCI
jgi:ligand-binding sensor domain-containing protein/signal transduction histidine kinase